MEMNAETIVNLWWVTWYDSPDKETAKKKLMDLVDMVTDAAYKQGLEDKK